MEWVRRGLNQFFFLVFYELIHREYIFLNLKDTSMLHNTDLLKCDKRHLGRIKLTSNWSRKASVLTITPRIFVACILRI